MEGVAFTTEANFLDIQPDSRIVFASTMAMGADGPAMREEGWHKVLDRLADHAAQAA